MYGSKSKQKQDPIHKPHVRKGDTVVVAVENVVMHGMYQKYIKRTNKFLAHNERPDINIGDKVIIEETRPLSKRKRWNVKEVVEKAS